MNRQEIITVLSELHKISGFRISLHNADYEEIAAYPDFALPFCTKVNSIEAEHEKCLKCDRIACMAAREKRGTYIYRCRYGLTEAVSPLYNFGTLSGFLMMGQVAESADSLEKAAAEMLALTGDRKLTDELVAGIPSIKPDMIASYVRIMTICAQYLTLSNATQSANPTLAEMAKKYINTNLSKKLSITEICDYLGCSKSTLLALFKKQYGITVNHYVTEKRLELARHKLGDSRLTIYEIAAMTGFADQSYFSKVFSARFGISPSEYRHKLLNFDTKSE